MAPPAKKGAAFFSELLKDNDPEFVKRIKAIAGDGDAKGPGTLLAHIYEGNLNFNVDNVNGRGKYDGLGGGEFYGSALAPTVQGGTFKLWVKSKKATLQLYDTAGNPVEPVYEGEGKQVGLDTPDDKPWEGDWD